MDTIFLDQIAVDGLCFDDALYWYSKAPTVKKRIASILTEVIHMPKATWNGAVIAETDHVEKVEGNYYFPPESIKKEFLKPSDTTSVCPWKGTANYYSLEVEGETNLDAAWYYAAPKEAAMQIKHYVAFWRGVKIED